MTTTTETTPTDYKSLCDELIKALVLWHDLDCVPSELPFEHDETYKLIKRARAALAEPTPKLPTIQELDDLFEDWLLNNQSSNAPVFASFALYVLHRYCLPF